MLVSIRTARRRAVGGLFSFIAFGTLCACGGSSGSTPNSPIVLPAASAEGCIYPATQAQTVALPTAGTVSGTISVGALATASHTCLAVTLATGADATLTSGTIGADAAHRRALATSVVPPPLVSVELSNTYDGQLTWATVTLQLPAGSVPAGSYPATITTTVVLGDGQTSTSVANFTVTVSSSGKAIVTGPSLTQALAVLTADTTGVLSIYARGTVLPTPTPVGVESASPSPTPASSPSPTAPPTAIPTATPTAAPTLTPTPRPTATPVPGAYTATISLTPGGGTCIQYGNDATTQVFTTNVSNAPPAGVTLYYEWQSSAGGTIVVPPPTTMNQGAIIGLQNTLTFTSLSLPQGTLGGVGGGISVLLLRNDPTGGGIPIPVLQPSGAYNSAQVVIAEGLVTCASEGYPSGSALMPSVRKML
jgi:hypothetical protein